MYLRIEEEFVIESKTRKAQKIFIGALIFFVGFGIFFIWQLLTTKDYFWEYYFAIILTAALFLFACYTYVWKTARKIQKKSFWDVETILKLYNEYLHDSDLKVLNKILKANNINTRPKVQEAIRHYQCVLPRKVASGGQLLTILALVISIIALIFSEPFADSLENIEIFFFILFTVAICYWVIEFTAKKIFKIFSKEALYTRMEASLSEIFMTYYLKKEEKQDADNQPLEN